MRPFTFVHAADLHLDSPFKGVTATSPAVAERLREATFDAFEALISLCIDRGADFLLIAGDIYDEADRSLRAQLRFRDGLVRLAERGIQTFVVHGNHDPLSGWASELVWPSGVHVFGGHQVETYIFEKDGEPTASISGISYLQKDERRNLARMFRSANRGIYKIGLLHCTIGSPSGHDVYAPCESVDLTSLPFDYWALGHVHEKAVISRNPYVVYPGNTQGRSIREQDERGCYLVSVDSRGQASMEFCPLDSVRWLTCAVTMEGLTSLDQLDRSISQSLDGLRDKAGGRSIVASVALVGRGLLYRDLKRRNTLVQLLERVREGYRSFLPFLWVQEIELDCLPEIDIGVRRESNDFLGQVLKVAYESRSDDKLSGLLEEALSDLYWNRRMEKAVGSPSKDDILRMLEEAEMLCIDGLEERE